MRRMHCSCVICSPPPAVEPGEAETADLVREHKWSSAGIRAENGVPGWSYTIGLWHTFRSPEVAIFGLHLPDMHHYVNTLGDQVEAGRPIGPGDPVRYGVLGNEIPVLLRPVHESWLHIIFGHATRFYRDLWPPFTQMVWPDQRGHFPWEREARGACKANQPQLWLPFDEHPKSLWTEIEAITPWPFPDSDIYTIVLTLSRILYGSAPIRGVLRDGDGGWRFLDGAEFGAHETRPIQLRHLYAKHPGIAAAGGLAPGRQSWLDEDGEWHESPYPSPPDGRPGVPGNPTEFTP